MTVIVVRQARVVVTSVDLTIKIARQLDIVCLGTNDMPTFYFSMMVAADRVLGRFNLKVLGSDYPSNAVLVIQDGDEVKLVMGIRDSIVGEFPLLVLT